MSPDESCDDRTQSFVALTKGTEVSHYRIIEKIGAGGMGEVYLAEDTTLNRKVALKFLSPHLCQDEDCRKRFKREAQAAAGLDHPNIVPVYEVGQFRERPFFAMAHIEGRSFREVIKESELTIADAINYTMQICEGLHKAHESGVVHRDIKPGNILIDKEDRARIVDFGLATVSGDEQLTKTGTTMGTQGYMSPEQIEGKQVDHRTDLFSVGVILYEMLTGRRPFEGDNDAAITHSITTSTPEPIARYKSGTSGELQQIVDKALSKDVSLRYQHADGMLTDLKRLSLTSVREQTQPHPSIAVLPFVNLSSDPEQEYFSDGLTEELMNALVRIPDLHVAARTSAFQFKGKTGDVESIGRQLRVERVLEGSVRKAGNRVRITAQLIDVANGFHIWSDKYDRDIEDIFAVQDEISQSVTAALKVVLLPDSQAPGPAPVADLEAHNLYLEGRHFLHRGHAGEIGRKAMRCFKQAIEIDPDYAPAWAGLSNACIYMLDCSDMPRRERIEIAREAAERAVTLDDSLVYGHCVLGNLKQVYYLDWKGAQSEFNRGLTLEPGNADAIRSSGRLAYAAGRLDEAISFLDRGVKLDPLNSNLFLELGWSLLCSDRLEEADAAHQRCLELNPARIAAHHFLGRVYLLEGRLEEALDEMLKEPADIWRFEGLALVYYALGRRKQADEALQELLNRQHNVEFNIAEVYAFWGEVDKAFEWLERARVARDGGVGQFTLTDPLFRNLHGDPRWQRFLAKIGLAD